MEDTLLIHSRATDILNNFFKKFILVFLKYSKFLNIRKKLIFSTIFLITILESYATPTFTVHVDSNIGDLYGVGYPSANFNNFYDSIYNIDSFIVTTPPTTDIDLYLSYPRTGLFSTDDANQIRNYLLGGGRVVIFSEHNGTGGSGSVYSNTALQMIGSSLRFDGAPVIDGGGHQDSIDGQILDDPFMCGVDVLNYAASDSVSGGTPIFLASDLISPIISYESIGSGIIFAVGDTNFVDSLDSNLVDNSRMFANFVPEPSVTLLVGIGLFMLISFRHRIN